MADVKNAIVDLKPIVAQMVRRIVVLRGEVRTAESKYVVLKLQQAPSAAIHVAAEEWKIAKGELRKMTAELSALKRVL